MNIQNYTPNAQMALAKARESADQLRSGYVGTEHLLLSIAGINNSKAVQILDVFGTSAESVISAVRKKIVPGTRDMIGNISYTPGMKIVLAVASRISRSLGHTHVGTEHFLIALMEDGGEEVKEVLESFLTRAQDLKEIARVLNSPKKYGPDADFKALFEKELLLRMIAEAKLEMIRGVLRH